ncbi:thiamine-phosphate kinase [Salicibibacter halophilus]|uniref:Thiamine-monophosphate kinase n=1 Tax=Salicibibacter halophilus TaxID=2502791 RepID=A0A514LLX9_9BACI|nr:thiamine-phosphate kinase [Salicibibacter halophilus]QDI92535.1 thiamine-phosphate kinase [Salicibibacter halophilus]
MHEFDLIRQIDSFAADHEDVKVGIGDDAAVTSSHAHKDVISCVDTICEGIHFKRSTLHLSDIGYKALAVNLSDIAAMGGTPRYYLVSLAMSPEWKQEEILEIYRGMNDLAERYGVLLIGGDTVSAQHDLMISVTVLGEIEKSRSLLRSSAREGDVVFASGTLGDSRGGLDLLLSGGLTAPRTEQEHALVGVHQRPEPQLTLGQLLKESGCRIALNDISDGLSSESWELAEASRVCICLEEEKIPVSENATKLFGNETAYEYALTGGEDFQLVGTVAKSDWPAIASAAKEKGIRLSAIGSVTQEGAPQVLMQKNGERTAIKRAGYRHQ